MSNTKTTRHTQYDVDEAWPKEKLNNYKDCLKRLAILSVSQNRIECHGASMLEYNNKSSIRSKFDIRFFKRNNKNKQPKEVEKELVVSFVKKAHPHFPPEARRLIDIAQLKWRTLYNTGTVFVGRHYKLPTRCVDWTTDPLIALFFACSQVRDRDKDGVIWWMDYNDFSDAIATQWLKAYGKNKNIEDDFEQDFTHDVDKEILIRFLYPRSFDRSIKQKAHIILSGAYNVHHDEAIHSLGVRKCGRIVISSKIKSGLLDKLKLWGINNTTLGIEDSYVDTIAAEIAGKIFGKDA